MSHGNFNICEKKKRRYKKGKDMINEKRRKVKKGKQTDQTYEGMAIGFHFCSMLYCLIIFLFGHMWEECSQFDFAKQCKFSLSTSVSSCCNIKTRRDGPYWAFRKKLL
jgi:hypothetical protein